MDQVEFDRVATSFAAFHAAFAPLFGRKEAQRRSEQYVRGLLVQLTDRRNAENVAETIEEATPRLATLADRGPVADGAGDRPPPSLPGGAFEHPPYASS